MLVFRPPRAARVVKARRPERPDNRAVRRALVRELGPLWQNVADSFRLTVDEHRLAASIASGGADWEALLAPWDARAASHLATAFRDAIEAGSRIGARHSGISGDLAVQGLTERATRWIATEGAKRITRINRATRESVRGVLADALRDRVSPTRAAQDIGRLTGLTRGQARAVRRYEGELLTRRIPSALADTQLVRETIAQDVERYRDRLLRDRGRVILETESQAAVQAGERLWWEQAAAENPAAIDLDATRKRWFTVQDERVCEICGPLHGVIVRFDEHFSSGDFVGDGPPAHPNCRCFLDYDRQGFGES